MSIQNQYLHRFAAFSMAVFGLYVFMRGVNTDEYKVMEDGSLMDSSESDMVCFKNTKTVLTFRTGFDIYRSISYGVSSVFLLLDLLLNSGYLTLPALVLAAGEIMNDLSDFCLATVLISVYIGGYPAAAYGLTYLTLIFVEVIIWLGTCKFHERCRLRKIERKMLRKKQQELSQGKNKLQDLFGQLTERNQKSLKAAQKQNKGKILIMIFYYMIQIGCKRIVNGLRWIKYSSAQMDILRGIRRIGH